MRQGSNGRRGRGRGSGRKPQNNRNQSFDSNGPSGRIRGTATQLHEKYLTLARDASASGDRITAESCYQYADHYYRIVLANQAPPDPYFDEPVDLDDDMGNRPQGVREHQGRDFGNREAGSRDNRENGQRRRMNGNGHDFDGGRDSDDSRETGGDRRAQRDDDRDGADADDDYADRGQNDRPDRRAAGRRNDRRDDGNDDQPRRRRPNANAAPVADGADLPDDAELRRALGVGRTAPDTSADVPTAVEDAPAEEPAEKPRRRRRPPSTRVSD